MTLDLNHPPHPPPLQLAVGGSSARASPGSVAAPATTARSRHAILTGSHACLVAVRAATPSSRLPPAAAARRSAAATSSPPSMPSPPGERGASAPTGRPSRTASRGRASGGATVRFALVTAVFGCGSASASPSASARARGGVNVERGAGVVARAVPPRTRTRRCRGAPGGRWRRRPRGGIGRGNRGLLRGGRLRRRCRRCGDRGVGRRHRRRGLRDPLRPGRRRRGRASRSLDGGGLVRRRRVVGRRHRGAACRPAVRRACESGQTGPGAEYPTSEPQRRRPHGHPLPPFRASPYVGGHLRVNGHAGAAAGCPAAAPHVTTQRFCFFFIPPWIARLHAPPRWSSHEPWPATCRESEP